MEIIEKDIVQPKLTIAIDRVTLKFPSNLDNKKKVRLANFTEKIIKEVGAVTATLRGQFSENAMGIYCIKLHSGNEKLKHSLHVE